MATYGGYQGYQKSFNTGQSDSQNLIHFNYLTLNSVQLVNSNFQPVSYNQTHSWYVNELEQSNYQSEASQFLHNLTEQFNFPTGELTQELIISPVSLDNLNQELALQVRQNRELAHKLKTKEQNLSQLAKENKNFATQKSNLELEINSLKNQITGLEKRPTAEQLEQAIKQEKNQYKHLVDPTTYRKD